MKLIRLALFPIFTASLIAQQPQTPPKKAPFAGFGNTALDRRPGVPAPPTPAPRTPSTPAPAIAAAASSGIVLADKWAGHLTQGAGGQTLKMKDLEALLSGYGSAEEDLGAHPEVTIYEGPPMDPSLGASCRITYLMPLNRAEALLMKSRGIVTGARAVAPGFPDGLFLHTYDIKVSIYNRLILVTDGAKPQPQVVSVILKAQNANWYPPSPPWKKLERDWHTHDYVNTANRGQPGLVIDTRVNDLRKPGRYIAVNTTGGFAPPLIEPPGLVLKPARNSPKETTTWYVPEPLIKLILFTLSKQMTP